MGEVYYPVSAGCGIHVLCALENAGCRPPAYDRFQSVCCVPVQVGIGLVKYEQFRREDKGCGTGNHDLLSAGECVTGAGAQMSDSHLREHRTDRRSDGICWRSLEPESGCDFVSDAPEYEIIVRNLADPSGMHRTRLFS
ncbi:hypothetical protein [Methanogenium cariaci]|uniref:hypothetical protein n=1 Tax=Methanogenium cariaci TaxID=2197 RepID=UPI000780F6D5|nr:hypothetical protein [Methanogenium cariaci]